MAMAVAYRPHHHALMLISSPKGLGSKSLGGPASICISRHIWRYNPKQFSNSRLRISRCEAAGGRDFDSRVSQMAEEARRKADEVFSDVKRKAAEFQEKNDVKGKVWTQLYISLGSIIAIISTIPSF
jgi:hypothetical protein